MKRLDSPSEHMNNFFRRELLPIFVHFRTSFSRPGTHEKHFSTTLPKQDPDPSWVWSSNLNVFRELNHLGEGGRIETCCRGGRRIVHKRFNFRNLDKPALRRDLPFPSLLSEPQFS